MSTQHSKQQKFFDLRFTLLLVWPLILFIIFYFSLKSALHGGNERAELAPESQNLKNLGLKMQVAGLTEESIYFYELFLNSEAGQVERGKVAFQLGKLYEELGNTKKALRSFYMAEQLIEKGEHLQKAKRKIVALLERLNKHEAARLALSDGVSLKAKDGEKVQKGGVVIATIAGEKIYLHQVNEALDMLPEQLRGQFSTPKGKAQFAQKFVLDEVLYRKALKAKMDEDVEIRKSVRQFEKSQLVQKVMNEDVFKNISVEASDVENFFEANKDRYRVPPRAQIYLSAFQSKKSAEASKKALKNIKGKSKKFSAFAAKIKKAGGTLADETTKAGLYKKPVFSKQPFLGSTKASSDILKLQEGDLEVLQQDKVFYLALVKKKWESESLPFEKIEEQVKQDYKVEKGQKRYSEVMGKLMKSYNVTLALDEVK